LTGKKTAVTKLNGCRGAFAVNAIRQLPEVGDNLLAHPEFVIESPPVVADGTIGHGSHGNAAGGNTAVVFCQRFGDLPALTHSFEAPCPDDPVFQLQAGQLAGPENKLTDVVVHGRQFISEHAPDTTEVIELAPR
jgi:hypothetical protein